MRVLVGFSAGGSIDIVTRVLAQALTDSMGQNFIVDNRAGAGGNLAVEALVRADADGYTILNGATGLAVNPSLYRKVNYTLGDLASIAVVGEAPVLFMAHPSVPANSIPELIKLAKARPGQIKYASAGIGSPPHLSGDLFMAMAGIALSHIPYKGATPALVDLMGGHIDCYFGGIAGVLPHIRSGKVRALAVTSEKRSSQLPEMPTIAEAALPGYDVTTWFGMLAPAGTPKDIITRISVVVLGIVNEPESKTYLTAQGVEPFAGGPERLAAYFRAEIPKFARVIKAAGIKPEF